MTKDGRKSHISNRIYINPKFYDFSEFFLKKEKSKNINK